MWIQKGLEACRLRGLFALPLRHRFLLREGRGERPIDRFRTVLEPSLLDRLVDEIPSLGRQPHALLHHALLPKSIATPSLPATIAGGEFCQPFLCGHRKAPDSAHVTTHVGRFG